MAGKRANPALRAEENIRQRWWRAKRKAVKEGDEPPTWEEFKAEEAADGNEAEKESEREAPTVAAKAASGSSSKRKRSRK
jgi:hypothetical protein